MMLDFDKYKHSLQPAKQLQLRNNERREQNIDRDIMNIINGINKKDYNQTTEEIMNGIIYACDVPKFATFPILYTVLRFQGYYVYVSKGNYNFTELLIGTEPLLNKYSHATVDQVIQIILEIRRTDTSSDDLILTIEHHYINHLSIDTLLYRLNSMDKISAKIDDDGNVDVCVKP